ncbi:MAG TPA: hypothetical protein VF170_11495, partial [Planctomycetaceae bacterium]
MRQLLLFPQHPPAEAEPPPLGGGDRAAVIDVLLRGGSPQAACRSLRLDLRAFDRAADEDAEFRRRLRHARRQMTENVVSVVYQAAVKGTPAAQALWLRTFPPDAYADPSEPEPTAEPRDAFQELSEDAAALQ